MSASLRWFPTMRKSFSLDSRKHNLKHCARNRSSNLTCRLSIFSLIIFPLVVMSVYMAWLPVTCLCDSSRCFMRTATTTLTSTNWAIRTKTTKKRGATYWLTQQFLRQSSEASHSSLSVSFMIPFQLSPAVHCETLVLWPMSDLWRSWTVLKMPSRTIWSARVLPVPDRGTPRHILEKT